MHIGHIKLFQWAKKRVDLLIVGLDSDGSISLSKGAGRPVFNQNTRLEVISELSSVDYVFGIRKVLDFNDPSSRDYYTNLTKAVLPNYLITHASKDRFADEKHRRALDLGIKPMVKKVTVNTSSTEIVEKIRRLD